MSPEAFAAATPAGQALSHDSFLLWITQYRYIRRYTERGREVNLQKEFHSSGYSTARIWAVRPNVFYPNGRIPTVSYHTFGAKNVALRKETFTRGNVHDRVWCYYAVPVEIEPSGSHASPKDAYCSLHT
jgi:hypothetical protein